MRIRRATQIFLICLFACVDVAAQRLDIKGVRKRSKAADCATIIIKTDFDELTVKGMSSDSIYRKKDCDYNQVWTQYVDLRYEREQGVDSPINRSFVLHSPYTAKIRSYSKRCMSITSV